MLWIDVVFWGTYLVSLYLTIFLVYTFLEKNPRVKKPVLKKHPYISVIIPAYNEENTIANTIKSAINMDYPRKFLELIVVNDGSKDKTLSIAKNIAEKTKELSIIVLDQKNSGKGNAMNRAIAKARGEFVISLDADSFVAKDTLKKMLPYFEDKSVASVSAIMKVRTPKNILQQLQWLEYILYAFMKIVLTTIHCLHVTPGPFTIYRKSALNDIGGFDETSIVEDQEIAYRLQRKHYCLVQSYEGDVTTIAPKNLKELYAQRKRWFKGSIITLYQHKDMIFNKKYGDFGMYQLPSLLGGMMLLFAVIIMVVRGFIVPLYEQIRHLFLLNFDLTLYYTTNLSRMISGLINTLFSFDYAKLFIIIVLFSVNIALLIKAHKYTNEKIKVANIIPLVLFFIVYFIILSFMWIGAIIDLIKSKQKNNWG